VVGRGRDERGAATLETSAAVALAGVVIGALVLVLGASSPVLAAHVHGVVCSVVTQSACPVGAGPVSAGPLGGVPAGGPGGAKVDTGDREDQERGSAGSRTGRPGEGSPPADEGTTGTPYDGDPLGKPSQGTTVTEPQPPPWQPPDEGSGPYDTQDATWRDHAKKLLIETLANVVTPKWPQAARNLLHFLGNTGEPLQQDVDRMLADVPALSAKVAERQTSFGEAAVKRARDAGATGPVTFPVSTDWFGFSFDPEDDRDWFLALGSMTYNQTGQVTVYPPETPGGAWRYEVTTRVNVYDQYNWDGSKATEILGRRVDDTELQRLHQVGLAREYRNQGRSTRTTVAGEVP
jgi:hypothetical protein